MVTAIVLFCASGTGIYGSLTSGMTGDHSILFAKSILDFFTAMIFACQLKKAVCLIGISSMIRRLTSRKRGSLRTGLNEPLCTISFNGTMRWSILGLLITIKLWNGEHK